MREIKFRAWDGENMRPLFVIHSQDAGVIFNGEVKDWPLMQYTGLKDKDGVEIYENDLLAFGAKEWYGPMYSNGLADYVFKVKMAETGEWIGAGICTEWSTRCEVIGNIHENPELLEQK